VLPGSIAVADAARSARVSARTCATLPTSRGGLFTEALRSTSSLQPASPIRCRISFRIFKPRRYFAPASLAIAACERPVSTTGRACASVFTVLARRDTWPSRSPERAAPKSMSVRAIVKSTKRSPKSSAPPGPAGEIVPAALSHLDKGGTLVLGGIHMSPIPEFPYELLYHERAVCSVANNTREDGHAFFREAAEVPVHTHTETFALQNANEALECLQHDGIRGAAVLTV